MVFEKEREVFEEYIRNKNLKHSGQRIKILEVFLKSERHLTADELYRLVKRTSPSIGYATVCRTLKLFCEAGLSREVLLEDGITRYEHLYGHEHHDHMICIRCGKFVEVMKPLIEQLQKELAEEKGFILTRHRLELYGICERCREKK